MLVIDEVGAYAHKLPCRELTITANEPFLRMMASGTINSGTVLQATFKWLHCVPRQWNCHTNPAPTE